MGESAGGQTGSNEVTNTCIETMTVSSHGCDCDVALTPVVLKERAHAILNSLARAKADCEEQMRSMRRVDLVKAVTGTSAIERAIDETRQTIDALESRG